MTVSISAAKRLNSPRGQSELEVHPLQAYPPMYTLQPVVQTREKQLEAWRKLVTEWAENNDIWSIDAAKIPLWGNRSINRQLSEEGIKCVVEHLIEMGNAMWVEKLPAKTSDSISGRILRIMWRTPSDVASDLTDFARKNGMSGGIYTLYELQGAFGIKDPWVLREAVNCLEERGLAARMEGSKLSEKKDGVKFSEL